MRILRVSALVAAVGLAAMSASASAKTITVTTTADTGNGTFRAAVLGASSGDSIVLPAGTITLTQGAITVPGKNALTIVGQGARQTVVSGNHLSRVLTAQGPLTISGITFRDGSVTGNSIAGAIAGKGLTITDSAFIANTSMGGSAAVAAYGGPTIIRRTLFQDNVAGTVAAGALAVGDNGTVEITDTTFARNFVGGGSTIAVLSDGSMTTTVTLRNVTFVGAMARPAIQSNAGQQIRYANSLFVNTGSTCLAADATGIVSEGHNVFEGEPSSGCVLSATDRVVTDARVGALGDHGGPTDTYLPLTPGPVLDGGDPSLCSGADVRGLARSRGRGCDVGALELQTAGADAGPATDVTRSEARLNGSVDARELDAPTWWFEWGTSTAYGNRTPGGTLTGNVTGPVSDTLTGLPAGTTVHYRLLATTLEGTTASPDATLTTAAVAGPPKTEPVPVAALSLSAVKLRRSTVRKNGTATLSYRLSRAARVTVALARATAGRRLGKRCVRPANANRAKRACTRYLPAGTVTVAGRGGVNTATIGRRFAKRARKPGRYRLSVTATPDTGTPVVKTVTLTVKR